MSRYLKNDLLTQSTVSIGRPYLHRATASSPVWFLTLNSTELYLHTLVWPILALAKSLHLVHLLRNGTHVYSVRYSLLRLPQIIPPRISPSTTIVRYTWPSISTFCNGMSPTPYSRSQAPTSTQSPRSILSIYPPKWHCNLPPSKRPGLSEFITM